MDEMGKNILTNTTINYDEHTQIGGRNLKGYVEHVVQCIAITYDIVPLFDVLKF